MPGPHHDNIVHSDAFGQGNVFITTAVDTAVDTARTAVVTTAGIVYTATT